MQFGINLHYILMAIKLQYQKRHDIEIIFI